MSKFQRYCRNWDNGNRKDVVAEIANDSHTLIFRFVLWLDKSGAGNDVQTFAVLMDRHREGQGND